MALIRTIADARKYVRLSNLADTSQLPDVEAVELLEVVPIIGTTLYDKLNTNFATYNTGASDPYSVLLRYVQRMVAPLSFANELGTYQALITDSGVRTMESNNMVAAHSWEFKALKADLLNRSAKGMELMIRHLYQNQGTITEWPASDEFKKFDQIAIHGAIDFDSHYKLYDPFRTFWILRPIINDVQERYIVPTIGREMLKWLKGRTDALITVDNVEVDMMISFKKAIAVYTIFHASVQQSVRITDAGFTVLASGNSEEEANSGRTDANALKWGSLRSELETMGREWLRDLVRYMKGAYAGDFSNDFSADFSTAFELGPLLPANTTTPVLRTNNGNRKIFVMGL